MFKKSQNQTWKARYQYLHVKITVMHYLQHTFNKFKFIFKHIESHFTSRLAANQMYEVTLKS